MSKMEHIFAVAENGSSKEKFVRDSYIELYSAIDAPESIDNVQFSDVFEETAQLVRQLTFLNFDYTIDVGYERRVGDQRVTEWHPFQSSAEGVSVFSYGCNVDGDNIDIGDKDVNISESYSDYYFEPSKVLAEIESRIATEEEEKEFIVPSEQDYWNGATTVIKSEHKLMAEVYGLIPGDQKRNFRVTRWEPTSMSATIFAIKRYKLAFDYEGHKCFIKQFATEERPNIYCSYKKTDNIDVKDVEKNRLQNNPEFQKNITIYKKGSQATLAASFLFLFCSEFLGAFSILGILLAIIGFCVFYRFGKKAKAQGEAIRTEVQNECNEQKTNLQNKKMQLLETRFANMGFEPLTEAEKERFMPKNQHKLIDLYSEPLREDEYEEEEKIWQSLEEEESETTWN